jgi:hypothetical protein
MINIENIISKMPFFIVVFYLFSIFVFSHFDWYADNFLILEKIEIFLLFVIGLHFSFNPKIYDLISKRSISTIISVSFLNLLSDLLIIQAYYSIYSLLILFWFCSILSYKWKI